MFRNWKAAWNVLYRKYGRAGDKNKRKEIWRLQWERRHAVRKWKKKNHQTARRNYEPLFFKIARKYTSYLTSLSKKKPKFLNDATQED